MEFLTEKRNKGCKYGTISKTRSALSTVINVGVKSFGQQETVTRFMKRVFKADPPTPKYSHIWKPEKKLLFFKNLRENNNLNLKNLTLKTITTDHLITV